MATFSLTIDRTDGHFPENDPVTPGARNDLICRYPEEIECTTPAQAAKIAKQRAEGVAAAEYAHDTLTHVIDTRNIQTWTMTNETTGATIIVTARRTKI